MFLYTVYVNKMSPYSNSYYLSSTVSIVILSHYCGVELTSIPINVKTAVEVLLCGNETTE